MKTRGLVSFALCFLGGLVALEGVEPARVPMPGGGLIPMPKSVKVSLAFDKPRYLLGENATAHFVLENKGTEPVVIALNYGLAGAGSFKVSAVDDAGNALPESRELGVTCDIMSGNESVKPGTSWTYPIPLFLYRRVDHPGRYLVRATQDFGWANDPKHPYPVAEAAVTFDLPTTEEAAALVEKMKKQAAKGSAEAAAAGGEFACLRYPVYLQSLTELATAGFLSAFQGLGRIATPEATLALISFLKNSDPKVVQAAFHALQGRLPTAPGEQYVNPEQARMSALCWKPEFNLPASFAGQRLLEGQDDSILAGALLIKAVGGKEASDLLRRALETASGRFGFICRHTSVDRLNLPEPFVSLKLAAAALRARGLHAGPHPSGYADLLLYCWQAAAGDAPRDEDWEKTIASALASDRWPIRQAALEALPQPLPAKWAPKVLAAFDDQDFGVERTACEVAGSSADKQYLAPLLTIVAVENNQELLNSASNAAFKLGAGIELLEQWAGRLADSELCQAALEHLSDVIGKVPAESWSDRTELTRTDRLALREAWRRFLNEHHQELVAGKRFDIGDPALKPNLFPYTTFQFSDGRAWPATTE